MNKKIEAIIREKPHLEDPFRFYQKVQAFIESASNLDIRATADEKAYSRELIGPVFDIFSQVIDFPEGALDPLKRAMELREIDFTRLPLHETPAFSLPYAEDDLTMMLFLLSKPWFRALAKSPAEGRTWEEGKCPVCKGQPSLIRGTEDREKMTSCSYCGSMGRAASTGCAVCMKSEESKQKKLVFEGEEGFTIITCDVCRSYVKSVNDRMLADASIEIADLMSLPLDILIQERGYMRRSPNPIGMTKITMGG